MKVYIAARFHEKEAVLDIYKQLRSAGHTITFDWTTHKNILPYLENIATANQYATNDMNGVLDCDVFAILTNQNAGGGSSTELGIALAKKQLGQNIRIFVVGDYLDTNIFYFHPLVSRVSTISDFINSINE